MKAYIVTFSWAEDPTVTSNVVLFGEDEKSVEQSAYALYPEHLPTEVERAPWLDKPEREP